MNKGQKVMLTIALLSKATEEGRVEILGYVENSPLYCIAKNNTGGRQAP